MANIPEELIKQLMNMTGMSRKQVEDFVSKTVHEMTSGPAFKGQTPKKNATKQKYTQDDYPFFLPAKDVRKFTVRVALKNVSPTVWRKFQCPSNITLRHLADLVLELMGWYNEHLNQICIGQKNYVPYYQYDEENDWSSGDALFQEDYTLADLLNEKGKTIRLEYDFGDGWQHDIRLSAIDEYKEGEKHDIVWVGGKRACPPEDCGGPFGYQQLLDLLQQLKYGKRLKRDDRDRLDWFGMDMTYDPEVIDIAECKEICEDFSCQ